MIKSINHIGIAVKNLDESIEIFTKIFELKEIHTETVENQKVKIASFGVGDILIELTQATDESSPISKFIAQRGEGIHHIAFDTEDVNSELKRLKNADIRLINETGQPGAHGTTIAFLHPKSTNGVLIELCNKDLTKS